jgi:hypothetical protein
MSRLVLGSQAVLTKRLIYQQARKLHLSLADARDTLFREREKMQPSYA